MSKTNSMHSHSVASVKNKNSPDEEFSSFFIGKYKITYRYLDRDVPPLNLTQPKLCQKNNLTFSESSMVEHSFNYPSSTLPLQ